MSEIHEITPVFLQTGFRTGGTWLWSRFRRNQRNLCFCEPLNEELQQITSTVIADLTPENSGLRHPTLEAPYFEEYIPLLNDDGKGVRGYRVEFGLESYFAPSDEQPSGIAEYLQSLLDFAASEKRQPVLKFTRGLARAAWLRSCFPHACQIALIRNPWAQFQSAQSLAYRQNNYTFLMIPLFAISRPGDGALKELCDILKIVRVPLTCGIAEVAGAYTALAREMSASELFIAWLGMFIASHARCIKSADLVISQDMLATSLLYRQDVEGYILAMTGSNVELSGCRIASPPHLNDEPDFDIRSACEVVYKALGGDYPKSIEHTQCQLGGI